MGKGSVCTVESYSVTKGKRPHRWEQPGCSGKPKEMDQTQKDKCDIFPPTCDLKFDLDEDQSGVVTRAWGGRGRQVTKLEGDPQEVPEPFLLLCSMVGLLQS